jgi:methanogenic corrinoid protein MtbC1
MDLETLIRQAGEVFVLTEDAPARYQACRESLLDEVNAHMGGQADIQRLLGGNTQGFMKENHRHHVDFMTTVFQYHRHELLAKTLPWVYRTYHGHGFSYDYFPRVLTAWKTAVGHHIGAEHGAGIQGVYDWMLAVHDDLIVLSKQLPRVDEACPELRDPRRSLMTSLLGADFQAALASSRALLESENGQEKLYLGVIQPVMEEIGLMWENDRINSAEEHLATSMVGRILSGLYPLLPFSASARGKAVVTSAPNEYHELGGRMLADMLEADGWDILFLGSNTPPEALLDMVVKQRPRFLAISLTMSFGLERVEKIIRSVRENPLLQDLRVMVGGAAFNADPDLWRQVGADAWAADSRQAVTMAREW